MDLSQLKLMPLANLPVVNTVANLLAAPSVLPQIQSRVIKTIGDNISQFSNARTIAFPRRNNPLVSIFSPENVSNLVSEIFTFPCTSSTLQNLAELYDVSLPISEAFSKFRFESKNNSEVYAFRLSPSLNSQESVLNSVSENSNSRNIFNTPLPLSLIKDFSLNGRSHHETRKSTPNRQPYEAKYEAKKEPRKTNGGLGTLFQKFLRRSIRQ